MSKTQLMRMLNLSKVQVKWNYFNAIVMMELLIFTDDHHDLRGLSVLLVKSGL